MITAHELRTRFLNFFVEKHDHSAIQGASLIPENDPTVLFTTAGMHPLVPYLLGEKHPAGTRLVDVQKCIRTGDIDEVGDNTHLTCFEMLGNWSLGDYFKEKTIRMSYEFLTTAWEDGGLGLNPDRLSVTVFEGDEDAPLDEEAAQIWESLGFVRAQEAKEGQTRRIFFYPKKENWWGPAGLTGPCGPDTEIFYYNSNETEVMWESEPADDHTPWVEIWNDVFMQYNKNEDGTFTPLAQQNVDTGMGLERVLAILNGKSSAYETDLFQSALAKIRELGSVYQEVRARIIADHLRAAVFILGDERAVMPSNTDQGYVLRRLIRRAISHGKKLGIEGLFTTLIAQEFITIYEESYPEFKKYETRILEALEAEEKKFLETLHHGENELQKDLARLQEAWSTLQKQSPAGAIESALQTMSTCLYAPELIEALNKKLRPALGEIKRNFQAEARHQLLSEAHYAEIAELVQEHGEVKILRGDRAFYYFETHGFPFEMTQEWMAEQGYKVDKTGFDKAMLAHQEKSRAGAEQKFAGGLADHSDETKRLHTATHLMLEALRRVLGNHVEQKGSNITAERLRFDFNHDEKLTPEQIAQVEAIVNEAIQADYPIHFKEMSVEEARAIQATGIFIDKYENDLKGRVKVYFMGDFSTEICGGPHVDHTGELGKKFTIQKEESSSSGIRRIKAILQ